MQTVTNLHPVSLTPNGSAAGFLPGQPQDQRDAIQECQQLLINKLSALKNQPRQDIMLAKLIIRANIVSLHVLNQAIAEASAGGTVSQILPMLLPSTELYAALKAILLKVLDGTMTFDQALSVVRKVRSRPQSVDFILRQECRPGWTSGQSVMDFLLIAGLIRRSDIDKVQTNSSPNTLHGLRLASVGALDSFTLHAAIRLRDFLNQGSVTMEQALSMLEFCLKYRIDVDTVFLSRN